MMCWDAKMDIISQLNSKMIKELKYLHFLQLVSYTVMALLNNNLNLRLWNIGNGGRNLRILKKIR
jgi:hypothetical protein